MKPANIRTISDRAAVEHDPAVKSLHPAWRAFIDYCVELRHGEIEILKIQDGIPVLAEVVRRKVKFSS
jgi:hypothetical protein